jgi:hypothetical protein
MTEEDKIWVLSQFHKLLDPLVAAAEQTIESSRRREEIEAAERAEHERCMQALREHIAAMEATGGSYHPLPACICGRCPSNAFRTRSVSGPVSDTLSSRRTNE